MTNQVNVYIGSHGELIYLVNSFLFFLKDCGRLLFLPPILSRTIRIQMFISGVINVIPRLEMNLRLVLPLKRQDYTSFTDLLLLVPMLVPKTSTQLLMK